MSDSRLEEHIHSLLLIAGVEKHPKRSKGLNLWRRCLCLLLAYTMLLNPAWLQQEAQAAINYGSLTTGNWGVADREIHYYYDDNGSCVKKIVADKDVADPETNFINKTLYTYNLHNQLVEVRFTTNGTTWDVTAYKYNDEGIRVEKNVNGTVTTYLVDSYNHTGYAQVLEERTNDVLTKTYIIGDDVIGEVNNYGTLKYYLCDGQGSVRHHTNASGVLISYYGSGQNCNTFAYDAYGNRVDPLKYTAGVTEGLFYCGEQWDAKAKMYYLRSRYYNPLTGLFNQMDSFAGSPQDPQSLHKYLYCHANPVNAIDPSGMFLTYIGQLITWAIQGIVRAKDAIVSFTVRAYLTVSAMVSQLIYQLRYGVQRFFEVLYQYASHGLGYIVRLPQAAWERITGFLARAPGVISESQAAQSGFRSHQALVRAWQKIITFDAKTTLHHFVEQGRGVKDFAVEAIHSIANSVPMRQDLHQLISNFYSSGSRLLEFMAKAPYNGYPTVREYVSRLSFEAQWQWGKAVYDYVIMNGTLAGFNPEMYGLP